MMNAENVSAALYWDGGRSGKNNRVVVAPTIQNEKKGLTAMQKRIMMWIMPIIVLLVMATALVLSPFFAHAAGQTETQPAITTPAVATPTPSSHGAQPNAFWFN